MRKPADPEEELRWMSQEVRGYVEAVLNSLAANVPKVGLDIPKKLSFGNTLYLTAMHFLDCFSFYFRQ
jgi:hypothetical protein